MAGKDKKPEIRFSGFTDAWEQRKLGDYIVPFSEVTTENNQYPVLTSSRKGIFLQTDYYDGHQIASADNTGYNIVPRGFFTYRHMSDDEIFKFNINNLVDFGIVSTLYPVFTTNSELDSKYLQYQLNEGADFQKFANLQKQGGSRTYMYLSKLKELKLTMPKTVEEQKSISGFFTILDNLITLHQRKYDKLVIVKKSLLEKMFPKDGANLPEIRFAEFTGAWEQRRLCDISDKVIEKNATLKYTETFTNSAGFGIISQRDYFDHDVSNIENLGGYYVVKNEDFVYNPRISTSAPVGPINRNKLGRNGVMSPLYTVFRTHDIDNTFLEHYFKSRHWHSYMKLNGDSGARSDRFSIKDSVFFEMPIPYPNLKEQLKIGEYLTKFDKLITLHQRGLEKLKIINKSMLEKMFV
jgi:type I restriction enzyme, S subunit